MADDAIMHRQLQPHSIVRAPSDGFRRAGSGASVTFDHATSGGLAQVPSITRTGSGGSKSSAKPQFRRSASTLTRTSSGVAAGGTGIILPARPRFASHLGSQWLYRCSRAKRSVAAGWAKLRAAAALASAPTPVEQDGFSRLPSGFQRVSFLARHCIQPWLLLCRGALSIDAPDCV